MVKGIKINAKIFSVLFLIFNSSLSTAQKVDYKVIKNFAKHKECSINSDIIKKTLNSETGIYKVYGKLYTFLGINNEIIKCNEISNPNYDCASCGALLHLEYKIGNKIVSKILGPFGNYARLPKIEILKSGVDVFNIFIHKGATNNGEMFVNLEIYTLYKELIVKSLEINNFSYDNSLSMLPIKENHQSKYTFENAKNSNYYILKIVDSGNKKVDGVLSNFQKVSQFVFESGKYIEK